MPDITERLRTLASEVRYDEESEAASFGANEIDSLRALLAEAGWRLADAEMRIEMMERAE